MAAEEQMLIDCEFSVSFSNMILESSNSLSPEDRPPYGCVGEVMNSQMSLNKTQVERKKNQGASNKPSRKSSSQITKTVKTTSLTDDGFGWRKYGQKIIQNNHHPRSYYRCTHIEENCEAKKWVQKESDNPPVYNTTYLGNHTCQNPHKVPQIYLPYASFDDSFDNQHYPSMSQTTLLCFDSPYNTNHTPQITDQMGFAQFSSSPQAADPRVFSNEPMIAESCTNMAEAFQQQLLEEFETYKNGFDMANMTDAIQQLLDEFEPYENGSDMMNTTNNPEYSGYFPPMESPSCFFESYGFDFMTMDEFGDLESVLNC